MLEILFTLGQALSALVMIYGLCLALDHALFGDETHAETAIDEHALPFHPGKSRYAK